MKHQLVTAALATGFVLVALLAGEHRRGALIGAAASGLTALGSILVLGRVAKSRARPIQGALAVLSVAFLVRIVLVALGTVLVARSGESIAGFVVAFFVPYFVFAAIEGAFVHSLRRGTGTA